MKHYRVGIVGCGRMGGLIDDEVVDSGEQWWDYRPISHAPAYAAIEKTDLVAIADNNNEKLQNFSTRYPVEPNHRYADYREMIEREQLDILSVTTPSTVHAETTVFAAENGVKGIYCEKGMACSMEEADAMRDACRRNNVPFNLGTSRRYHPGMQAMRRVIDKGEIGPLQTLIHKGWGGLLLHSASHTFDTILYLLDDPEIEYVQGELRTMEHENGTVSATNYSAEENCFMGNTLYESDPGFDHARIVFRNGISAHHVRVGPCYEFEAIGTIGSVAFNHYNKGWIQPAIKDGSTDRIPFPSFQPRSFTINIIRDLIQSIECGSLGHLEASHQAMEISMAVAQSHIENGRCIPFPISNRTLKVPNY